MYDVAVTTHLYRADGRMFADLGTFRWFGVDEEMRAWLAGSCKQTAFWLVDLPQAEGEDTYELRYRTLVTQGARTVSDTGWIEFGGMAYADMVRFERWALAELGEMLDLFAAKHGQVETPTRRRSKWRTWAQFISARFRTRRGA